MIGGNCQDISLNRMKVVGFPEKSMFEVETLESEIVFGPFSRFDGIDALENNLVEQSWLGYDL